VIAPCPFKSPPLNEKKGKGGLEVNARGRKREKKKKEIVIFPLFPPPCKKEGERGKNQNSFNASKWGGGRIKGGEKPF